MKALGTWALLTATLVACSGGGGETDDLGGAGSGTGGSDADGSGGTDGGGTGGGTSEGGCTGSFTTAEPFFEDGTRVNTPALTADELELFYVKGPSTAEVFYVSKRSSKAEAFPAGSPVAELNAECEATLDRSIDVSEDGLTVYFSCYTDLAAPTELYAATRDSRTATFDPPTVVGTMTPSSSIEDDGLSAVWSGEAAPSTKLSTRTSATETFSAGEALSGLETTNLFSPDLSADGRAVFGAIATDMGRVLAVSTRTSTDVAFGEPVPLTSLLTGLSQGGAPELSADCRTLYFIGVDAESNFAVYRAKR